jgi:hypothetical protein
MNNSRASLKIIFFSTLVLLCFYAKVYGQWVKHYIDQDLSAANSVFVADINNDDTLDVIASGFLEDKIYWYEAPNWDKHYIGGTDGPWGLSVNDIDNDTDLDVVVSAFFSTRVLWYEAPSWTQHTIYYGYGMGKYPALDVSDLNSDDKPDVIVSDLDLDQIYWFEGLSWNHHVVEGSLDDVYDIEVADINGDDELDIVAAGNIDNDVVWYDYNGSFWTANYIDQNNIDGPYGLFVADINDDDNLDVIVGARGDQKIYWYENPSWTKHLVEEYIEVPTELFAADIDNDNDLDIVVTGAWGNNLIWYEAPSWSKHIIDESLLGASGLFVIDFDDDNDLDIITTAGNEDAVVWYENTFATSVENICNKNYSFNLFPNFPNPFNPSTKIRFNIAVSGFTSLKVYDLLGNEVSTLVNEEKLAGDYEVDLNAEELTSGVYFYQLRAGEFIETKKMLLIK